jgi:hypothetical protein
MNIQEIACEKVNWTHVRQDRVQWWAVINMVLKLGSVKEENLTSWDSASSKPRPLPSTSFLLYHSPILLRMLYSPDQPFSTGVPRVPRETVKRNV